jgi:stage II sporulation protein M
MLGSVFIEFINQTDQSLVKEYITSFFNNITSNDIQYLTTFKQSIINNLGYVLIVWLLGISVIGLPIIIFIYFLKIFILGFSISSFILTYHVKGLIVSFIYIFPQHIISIIIYLLITLYSVKMSNQMIYSIFKKKEINIKKYMNRYITILVICLIGMFICSLYETFMIPFLFRKLSFLING